MPWCVGLSTSESGEWGVFVGAAKPKVARNKTNNFSALVSWVFEFYRAVVGGFGVRLRQKYNIYYF
jgi:hypothetical protein